jgi:hypothetical protein
VLAVRPEGYQGELLWRRVRPPGVQAQRDPDRGLGRARELPSPDLGCVLLSPGAQRVSLARVVLRRDRDRAGAGRGEQLEPERAHPGPVDGDREHVLIGCLLPGGGVRREQLAHGQWPACRRAWLPAVRREVPGSRSHESSFVVSPRRTSPSDDLDY